MERLALVPQKIRKKRVPGANLIAGILRGGNWSEQTVTMCECVLL